MEKLSLQIFVLRTLFIGVFMIAIPVSAQVSISADGKVGVGTTPESSKKLLVEYGLNSSNTRIVTARFTGSGNYDVMAFHGSAIANPAWGIGGQFEGGWSGVYARAEQVGSSNRKALIGRASGGSTDNYGTYTFAEGSYGNKYGLYAYASGSNGIKYALWAGVPSTSSSYYAGYFSGRTYFTQEPDWPSDARLKQNVESLRGSGILEKITRVRPVSYEYKSQSELKAAGMGLQNLPSGKRIGFIAQELEQVFPELVHETIHVTPPGPDDEKGASSEPFTVKSVSYISMIPVLVQALQEQQEQIEALQQEVNELKSR